MMRWQLATGFLAAGAVAGMAAAQDYRPAPPQIEGEIAPSDAADAQGRRYDEYAVELARGDAVMVAATPAAGSRLEPAIEIYEGDAAQPLTRDDADPATRAARLTFSARGPAVYRIRVLGGTAAAGGYLLQLRRTQLQPNRGFGGGNAIGGSVIGGVARPAPGVPNPLDGAAAPEGPRSRFIICPGHPRCPR